MERLGPGDPRQTGAYRLLGRLGAGGMGQVYLARSDRGRTVAVKVVRAELAAQEEFRARFRQEVRAARQVGGHWTAPVLDADTEAAVPWVATGYVAGPSLQQVVGHDHGPLPERSVRILAAGLAHALKDIHAAGIIHRDLKPSNVLVTIDGPRVIDFGIARALETVTDGGLTRTGALVGSPGFMAPEQVRGDRITPACDVFCLGSVLAYAATGALPFGGADSGVHALMFRIAQEEPDLSRVPEGIADLVRDCLRKDPAARPTLDAVLERTGAEDTVSDGRALDPWLPGALVAQLGRHAVRLLETESPESAGPSPEHAASADEGAGVPRGAAGPGAPGGPGAAGAAGAHSGPGGAGGYGVAGAPGAPGAPGLQGGVGVPGGSGGPGGPGGAAGHGGPGAPGGAGVPAGSGGPGGAAGYGAAGAPDVQGGPGGPGAPAGSGGPGGAGAAPPLNHLPTMTAGQAAPAAPPPPAHPAYGPPPAPPPQQPPHGYPQQGYGYPQQPGQPYPQQPYPQQPYGGPPSRPASYGGLGPTPPYGLPPHQQLQEPGRRSGRATALLVVVALIVALAAGGSVYALMNGDGDADAGPSPTPTPTATTEATTAPPTPGPSTPSPSTSTEGADGAIPAAYLGTWTTTIDNADGVHTRELTIQQGEPGDTVLSLVADGPTADGDYHCVFAAALSEKPAGDGPLRIGPSTVTTGEPLSSCSPGEATEITLLSADTLQRVNTSTGEELTYTRS
ncbi:serine/threonine-protein kinase [Streptomyces sp. NPDC001595]|uniref:serine/threonine-protein kinase n=1 Tax=Streptomyces sp. NPDC001532 TaxID=3154520 RepID=UPI00332F64FE